MLFSSKSDIHLYFLRLKISYIHSWGTNILIFVCKYFRGRGGLSRIDRCKRGIAIWGREGEKIGFRAEYKL